ncbi:MAG TPA: VWA domain-containing protein [Thermoanaerobaculia bacterium]|nr:VWA domain-containing protein [Thermoanaerobaculia bacterium]
MPRHRSPGWILLWALLALAAAPSRGDLRQLSWTELSQRVAGHLIPLDQLGVAGCPTDLALRRPDRRVLQIIENVFYSWEEYDLTPTPGQSFCVVVRRPFERALTAGEAQVLLTASSLWLEPWVRSADAESLAADDPALERSEVAWRGDETPDAASGPDRGVVGWVTSGQAPAEEEGSRRPGPGGGIRLMTGGSVIGGTDERARVTDTNAFPHRLISFLSFDTTAPNGASQPARASGFLAGPYMVLTNGHVVWDDVRRQFSRNLVIIPAQSGPGGVNRPFGTRTAVRLATNPGWVETAKIQYDYGAAFFDIPFSGISTFMPLAFDVNPAAGSQVRVAGYPLTVKGSTSYDQWVASDKVVSVQGRLLRYRVDTSGGNSGSPVWQVLGGGQVRTIAIHSTGDTTNNGNSGARLVSDNFELLSEWLSWTPQTRSGLNLTINQVDPDQCPLVKAIVSVTDNAGKPVIDLTRANFTLNENGFPQVVDVAQAEVTDSAISVALILDDSSSLSGEDIANIKDASRRFVDLLGPRDKVAVYHFSDFVTLVQDYTSDKNLAKAAINALGNGGSTSLYDAIIEGADHSTTVAGRRALVVMTDGMNNQGTLDVNVPIQAAQAAAVPVFTIGFGSVDVSVLDQIAAQTGGRFFLGASSGDLQTILQAIGRTFDTQYLLSWVSRFVSGGQQSLEVQVADGAEQDSATSTYSQAGTAGCPPPGATCDAHVIRPNGGETWTKGKRQTLQWSTTGPSCGPTVGLAISDGSDIWYLSDTLDDGTEPVNIDFLPPGVLYHAIVADRATGRSDSSDDTFTIAAPAQGFTCVKGPENLCLLKGRFQVRVLWRSPGLGGGFARAVAVGDNAGYFWFFDNTSGELAVRMEDGRSLNGNFWFFSGALTSIDYSIFVTDVTTGDTRVYTSVEGEFRSFADDSAFGSPPETAPAPAEEQEPVPADGAVQEDGSRAFARLPAGTGPSPGLLSAALPATQKVLWVQTDHTVDVVISSENRLDPGAGDFSTEAADDFVVPAGKTWLLQGVDVLGAYYGPSAHGPAQSVNVSVYLDRSGLPGTLQCSQRNLRPRNGLGTGTFIIDLPSACHLTAGRYWIAVQANQNFSTSGQWGWGERTAVRERDSVWRNPGGGYGSGCLDWGRRSSCGLDSGDYLFQLRGEESSGGGGGTCKSSATALCLAGKRFKVETTWRDAKGKLVAAKGTALTGSTGYFSFGGSALDLIVKIVDGVALNGHFWAFYGGLSRAEFTVKITDPVTGVVKTFTNLAGNFTSGVDTTTLPP